MNSSVLPLQTTNPNAPADDMANTHDGRAAKRQQRTSVENDNAWSQAQKYHLPSRVSLDSRSSFANRRRSGLRDYKPPLGPRPPDFANNKRAISESVNTEQLPSRRSFIPHNISEPFLGLSARRQTLNLDYIDALKSTQIIPSTAEEMQKPRGPAFSNGNQSIPQSSSNRGTPDTKLERKLSWLPPAYASPGSRSRNETSRASPAIQRNPALCAAQVSTASATGSLVITPLTIRTKRQSQVAPYVPNVPESRQPRKSVGPGLPLQIPRDTAAYEAAHRFPQPVAMNGRPPDFSWNSANVKPKPRASIGPSTIAEMNREDTAASKRASRIRSFQPSVQGPQGPGQRIPGDASDEETPMRGATPGQSRPHVSRANTSTSSVTKRQPLGLSRTISPTDARIMKHASAVNSPPPMPRRTPTPELTSGTLSARRSPTPTRQKTSTPSSFRATPEADHRFGAGRSLSSRSSLGSLGQSNSSLPHQSGTAVAAVQSPSMKPKTPDGSAAETLSFVPPVPAIPKAFESPNQNIDEPFFEADALRPLASSSDATRAANVECLVSSRTKVAMAPPEPQILTKSDTTPQGSQISSSADFPMAKDAHSRRRFTLGSKEEQKRASASQHSSSLHQTRLPPLKLAPLSVPTSEKIALLGHNQSQNSRGRYTPPSRQQTTKTPSTPMTASKATFPTFNNKISASDLGSMLRLRSSNANRDIMPVPPAPTAPTRVESNDSSPTTFLTASPGTSLVPSPTVPPVPAVQARAIQIEQVSQDGAHKRREPQGDHRTSRLVSLRSRAFSRSGKESSTPQQPNPPQADLTNVVPTSRRMMGFGWRRSSSKASHTPSNDEMPETSSEKQPAIPAPRLPPPGALGETLPLKPSVSSQSRQVNDKDLVKPLKSSITAPDMVGTDSIKSREVNGVRQISTPVTQAASTVEKNSSLLSPVHKILGSRHANSASSLPHPEAQLNRDDLAADEEMKKLASKKKEFEAAAKDVDDLRKKASPKERVTPAQAAKVATLNIFERGEIIDYPDVYFCGLRDSRKYVGDIASQASNFGYDDERGDYNIVMGDHLSFRYEVVDLLGKGSFGQVVRCIDHKTGKLVAVKIIRNKKRFHQQALVEVNILQRLREWDPPSKFSNVEFTQSFYFRGHLCIATELLGMNLYEFIKAHEFKGFSLKLIKRFTRQILSSLSLLQKYKVIHCDLKPENILLAHPLQSEIKVIDFGSSCFENEKVYTYIQSRFYRSPEVILGMDYGMPIDMWSIGCILAELFTGYPIFPGENEQEQLACIMEIFGPPEKHLIERSSRKKLFFDSLGKPRMTVSSKGKRRRPSTKTLQQAIKCDDEAFLDFLTQCLRWDPERRLKPDRAMTHDFVTGMRSTSRSVMGSGSTSPAKRTMLSSQTPAKLTTRALPDPPMTSYKHGVAMNSRGVSSSPQKSAVAPRRHSTMLGIQAGAGVKRGVNGVAVVGSAPLRKPDMASAAAIASLRQR